MRGKASLAVVFALLALPALLAVGEAISFHVRNRNDGFMISSGERRKYRLYVPRTYDRNRPAPLVISLHGAGGWPAQQEEVSQWDRVADREGFIVVYPAGVDGAGPRIWRTGEGLARDVRFISDLIEAIEMSYNIDPKRIYANGLSNGGGMSFALSCTMSDRIAAVGLVAAAETLPWSWCRDTRPVPMIEFHGTDDRFMPYNGGTTWMAPGTFPDVPRWAANWARRNHCAAAPLDAIVASDVVRREYTACANNASVILYTIRDGGHTWPGGEPMPEWFVGRTTRSIDASALMWSFFREHPLSE
ncbi:MAG TPA: PHB depolymerase family esterase [Thermoanaerobaculia bacterium]|nr:PHB depolymerase family esterase [Thermoanaerobaculia bacterium]